jgi:hypothetical protein
MNYEDPSPCKVCGKLFTVLDFPVCPDCVKKIKAAPRPVIEPDPQWKERGAVCPWEHCIEAAELVAPTDQAEDAGCPLFGHYCPGGPNQVRRCERFLDAEEERNVAFTALLERDAMTPEGLNARLVSEMCEYPAKIRTMPYTPAADCACPVFGRDCPGGHRKASDCDGWLVNNMTEADQ